MKMLVSYNITFTKNSCLETNPQKGEGHPPVEEKVRVEEACIVYNFVGRGLKKEIVVCALSGRKLMPKQTFLNLFLFNILYLVASLV